MAVVLTVLLHACESCTVYRRHARKLNHIHTTSLRISVSITWQDMVPDIEVVTGACIHDIRTLLQKPHLILSYFTLYYFTLPCTHEDMEEFDHRARSCAPVGWESCSDSRRREEDPYLVLLDLTLPYLTLPYPTLPYLT